MKERKGRRYWLHIVGGVLTTLGIMLLGSKALCGDFVDADGILHEAFFLLPIGFFALFLGLAVLAIGAVLRLWQRHRKK